jgi:uncharacterized protein with NRDE domain
MCTLIALHRCVPGAPLVVAANRDEFSDRPSAAPALRDSGHGLIVAPSDVRAGGTWLGLNPRGLFAAVTNRRCEDPDPRRRSRGLLVLDALGAAGAREAAQRAEKLPSETYNPFNLFVADRDRAVVITYEKSPRRIDLGPGAHVIGNADPLAAPSAKVARLREQARAAAAGPPERLLDRLAAVCREHVGDGEPLGDTCVHAGAYGTRSSTLLRLAEPAHESVLRFADGPPCETAYDDFTHLLRDLNRGSGYAEGVAIARNVS